MAFLEKCYHSNGDAKGITAPTEQEWQDIFDMLRGVRPRKDKRGFDLISDVLPFAFMTHARAHGRVQEAVSVRT